MNVKIPWCTWVLNGNWYPNNALEISEEQQFKENQKNGFFRTTSMEVILTRAESDIIEARADAASITNDLDYLQQEVKKLIRCWEAEDISFF